MERALAGKHGKRSPADKDKDKTPPLGAVAQCAPSKWKQLTTAPTNDNICLSAARVQLKVGEERALAGKHSERGQADKDKDETPLLGAVAQCAPSKWKRLTTAPTDDNIRASENKDKTPPLGAVAQCAPS